MPRFSVIVPAYKVRAYLPACLESVLSQSYEDLELIAVDDRSPDACGEIVDEFAARDPRVRAVHLARNAGLGPARNAGTAEASGDYLLFLDGDDTLAPHALRAIADRDAYEAARGTYFDLRSFAPGAVARSEDELIGIFATGHWRGSRSTQLRSAFRERFCPYDDGRAAERVVRHVVLGETGVPAVVPLAERHRVPSAAAALDRSPPAPVPRPATHSPVAPVRPVTPVMPVTETR